MRVPASSTSKITGSGEFHAGLWIRSDRENEVESFGAPTQLSIPLPQRFDAPLAMIPENGDLDATGLSPSFRQSPDVLTLQDRSISRAYCQDHPHDSPNDR